MPFQVLVSNAIVDKVSLLIRSTRVKFLRCSPIGPCLASAGVGTAVTQSQTILHSSALMHTIMGAQKVSPTSDGLAFFQPQGHLINDSNARFS